MKITNKAEVRLTRKPKWETINKYDVEKIESLVISNDRLLKDNKKMYECLSKLLRPLIEARIPKDIVDKIMNNKFKSRVFVKDNYPQDPLRFSTSVGWLFEIPLKDLGVEFQEWRKSR
jgi:dihydroxyacetone kinase-like predicted kinase